MPSRYDQVLAKYNWAKKHIDDLEVAVDSFRLNNPHSIGREHDTQAGEFVYYVKAIPTIPDGLSFMLGDALHNLRSTLDHLACALVEAAGGKPNSKTCFPIFDTPKAFSDMSRGKVPGLGKYALCLLDNIQPYEKGFGHWAWQLHKLDIIDKHRILLTVSTVAVGRSMLPSEKRAFDARKSLVGPVTHFLTQLLFAASAPPIRAVEAGQILARFPATEEHENVGFAFDIALDEPSIAEGVPTFLLLRNFSAEVQKVISDFARFL
jgi:hypothetical protein